MSVPFWVEDAIFYQIFPDRFYNGDRNIDPPNVEIWGSSPTITGFQGGDLNGIIQKFDYLLDLGINAIYLNPIFHSTSNHRYNTSDYFKIDPKLGNLKEFHTLIEIAHKQNVRIILDGVFNHCGRGFFAFNDVLENNEHSPYRKWFYINKYPLDAYSPGDAKNYKAWWDFKSLPKLNFYSPEVRSYFLKVARYWIEQGADGWRLDVPNEIDNDSFWADFRFVVKSINSDAYLLGEIWDGSPQWVGNGHFDGIMQYPVRDALIDYLSENETAIQFADRVEELLTRYTRENTYAMYIPLGSHDTERFLTLMDGDVKKVFLAQLFQFAYPGAPAIYYGDEIGLEGEKDPDCRRSFTWDPNSWNKEISAWVRKLIRLRSQIPALRRGIYRRIFTDELVPRCYAFIRSLGVETVLVVMNCGSTEQELRLAVSDFWSNNQVVLNILGQEDYQVFDGIVTLKLAPYKGMWLK